MKEEKKDDLKEFFAEEPVTRRSFLKKSVKTGIGVGLGVAALESNLMAASVKKPAKLTMWLQKYYVPEANEIIEEAAKAAATKGNFEIDIEFVPWDDKAYAKWSAAVEGRQLPDVGMPPGYPSQYQAMGRLVDISDLFGEIGRSGGGWYDYVEKDATMGGKQYWVPIFAETAFAHYRVDLFEKAGFKVPMKDIYELLEAGKAITRPEEQVWGIGVGLAHGDWPHHLLPFMWAFGAKFQDENNNITVDTPEMVEAITWYTDLYTKHKVVPPGAPSWDPGSNNRGYLAGQLAFVSNPGSILNVMRKENQELLEKTQFAAVPGRGKFPPTASSNFPGLFVSTDSKYPDEAKQIIETIMSEEYQERILTAGGSNLLPVLKNMENIPFFTEDRWNQQIIKDILPYARPRSYAGVGTPTFSEVDSLLLWGKMLQRVSVEEWTPEDAVQEFAKKVAEIEAKYA